jgi:hypothetical protein
MEFLLKVFAYCVTVILIYVVLSAVQQVLLKGRKKRLRGSTVLAISMGISVGLAPYVYLLLRLLLFKI